MFISSQPRLFARVGVAKSLFRLYPDLHFLPWRTSHGGWMTVQWTAKRCSARPFYRWLCVPQCARFGADALSFHIAPGLALTSVPGPCVRFCAGEFYFHIVPCLALTLSLSTLRQVLSCAWSGADDLSFHMASGSALTSFLSTCVRCCADEFSVHNVPGLLLASFISTSCHVWR